MKVEYQQCAFIEQAAREIVAQHRPIWRWLGLRWHGIPWPLRLVPNDPYDHGWGIGWRVLRVPGCGCVCVAKSRLRRTLEWMKGLT